MVNVTCKLVDTQNMQVT